MNLRNLIEYELDKFVQEKWDDISIGSSDLDELIDLVEKIVRDQIDVNCKLQ